MGYTTDFAGYIEIDPPLNLEEIHFLEKFNSTRRMLRKKGPYYVDGAGDHGQDHEDDVMDYNKPPEGQPGLWCQWIPNATGTVLEWDGGEKFYNSAKWMKYIINHFLSTYAAGRHILPFLQAHTLNGTIEAQGEESDDMWLLHVKDNIVSVQMLAAQPTGPEELV